MKVRSVQLHAGQRRVTYRVDAVDQLVSGGFMLTLSGRSETGEPETAILYLLPESPFPPQHSSQYEITEDGQAISD